MIHNINIGNGILSSFTNYRTTQKKQEKASNSIIEFDKKAGNKTPSLSDKLVFADLFESTKAELQDTLENSNDRIENEDGSYTEITRGNGTEKKVTKYKDGSFDEIYKSKGGISYMRIKRYENANDYTEIYRDSSGFCGKETFTQLEDGTSVSVNEFNNGKKYTETYRKNPDGGFTRKLENSDKTGYTETQKYNKDGTSSYSIENEDGSENTVIYNPDGSYVEIVTDSNGKTTVNKFGG